jgi:4-diphosphocytidyl-2-C-methyl-D-erythritol kinase
LRRQAFAPAKVNLFLHVGAPGLDGYHPLCSLMVFADLGDRLTAEPATALELQVSGPFAREAPAGPENLVLRAAQALSAGSGGASLILDKALPVAAGLGGGSSDAGAALRLLRDLWSLPLDDAALESLAAGLGADGAACLWGRPVLAQGRGERLSPAPPLPRLDAVLVNPAVPVSTPQVYRRLDASGRFGDIVPPEMPDGFAGAAELADWLAGQRNDLEAPACAIEPAVATVLATLAREPKALLARVSGSGGTCFALCRGADDAEAIAGRIASERPGWWVRACRLGGPWPDEGDGGGI